MDQFGAYLVTLPLAWTSLAHTHSSVSDTEDRKLEGMSGSANLKHILGLVRHFFLLSYFSFVKQSAGFIEKPEPSKHLQLKTSADRDSGIKSNMFHILVVDKQDLSRSLKLR